VREVDGGVAILLDTSVTVETWFVSHRSAGLTEAMIALAIIVGASNAGNSTFMTLIARIGFDASGLTDVVTGYIAVRIALHHGGESDQSGASRADEASGRPSSSTANTRHASGAILA
jgi:hypothetical protein